MENSIPEITTTVLEALEIRVICKPAQSQQSILYKKMMEQ